MALKLIPNHGEWNNKMAWYDCKGIWKSFLIIKIIFMSHFRQFKPGAELCQAKNSIWEASSCWDCLLCSTKLNKLGTVENNFPG